MTLVLIVVGVPLIPVAIGTAFGIRKDGSPFRRDWWTS